MAARPRKTPRRIIAAVAALGLMTGLLAALGSAGVAQATGVPSGGFTIPAGSVATLQNGEFDGGAVNSLTWGYTLNGGDVIVGNNAPPTNVSFGSVTMPVSGSAQTLQVFLIDHSCSDARYNSDGTPYDHVTATGADPYRMDFFDAGGGCWAATTDRHDASGFNFHVDLAITPFPLTVTKTANASTVAPGGTVGYTINVANPNSSAVALSTITDALPSGFAYVTGSTTDVTTSDPTGTQNLTWSPSEVSVPANGSVSLSFQATASTVTGDYYNNAGGTSTDVPVTPTGDTALITVTSGGGSGCPAVAPDAPTNVVAYPGNASAVLTWNAPEGDGGAPIESYTVNVFDQSTESSYSIQTADAGTTAQVTELTNGDNYTFSVQATNCAGTGLESAQSNGITPMDSGSSAVVIGPGSLSQTTGTPGVPPSPDDTTVGIQTFPAGTTGIGTLQELTPGGLAAVRAAAPLAQFCGGVNPCIGNIIEAKLHSGTLGLNPHGGVAFYRLRLLLDSTIVPDLGKAYLVWYDGNLSDDNDLGGDPTPPATLAKCGRVFTGTPCIANLNRTKTLDLRIIVKTQDLDPRLSTSK